MTPPEPPADVAMTATPDPTGHAMAATHDSAPVTLDSSPASAAEATPDTDLQAVLQQQVRAATAARTPLRIRGGGTKDFYGRPVDGTVLEVAGHRGVIDYEPTELVLTARCGTPLAAIEALLAERDQMLAFEPPHFGPGATLGGCIAAGLAGPRRMAAGGVRDFVLGARLLDGDGRVLDFGGRVMKNVAGYDVARSLAGSLGQLGVILEASVKVLPRPAATRTLRFDMDERSALRQLNDWAGTPLPISASAWHDGVLTLRLCGAQAAVAAAVSRLGGETVAADQASAFWAGLREQTDPFFAATDAASDANPTATSAAPLWRLALPPTAPAVSLPGTQLIEWGGGQRWWRTDAPAQTVRAAAQGGHATLFRAPATLRAEGEVFTRPAGAVLAIQQRLMAGFDPARIFNPGRRHADF